MGGPDRIQLPAVLESLTGFREYVLGVAEDNGLTEKLEMKLDLLLEEVLVNVISYAYPDGKGMVEVVCHVEHSDDVDKFILEIKDWGTPFDPLAAGEPDLDLDVEERPIGGLGIHMVKEMTDELGYQNQGGKNVLRLGFNV